MMSLQVQILKSRYGNLTNVVGITGSSIDLISSRLWTDGHFAVTMIDNTTTIVNDVPVRREFKYKLQVFVVTASTSTVLQNILKHVKESLWWNHMARFFILGVPTSKHGCLDAHDILWTAWEADLLHAKFLCLDESNGTLIYSYNPYTKYAPHPWKLVGSYPGKNNHPWTLFVGNFRELVSNNLQDLEFKTTNDLNGYEIPYIASDMLGLWETKLNKTGIESFGGSQGEKAEDIYRALNATAKRVNRFGDDATKRFKEGLENAMLKELVDGSCDISLNHWYLMDVPNMVKLYPLWQSGISVSTQYRNRESQLSKIWRVIDNISWISVFVVTLTTLIFFKYCLRKPVIIALLDIMRLACNSSLLTIPNNLAVRIYLACIFIFIVTMQGIFQGKLASLLTKDVLLPNVETMQELVDSQLTIYVYETWLQYFDDQDFEDRLISIPIPDCVPNVLNDSRGACVCEVSVLLYLAARNNLHMSTKNIYEKYYTYAIRENWPLEQRLNEVLSSLTETSIVDYKWMKELNKPRRILDAYKEQYEDDSFDVVTLEDLNFAFVILGVGLGCATVTFIIEIFINRGRARSGD